MNRRSALLTVLTFWWIAGVTPSGEPAPHHLGPFNTREQCLTVLRQLTNPPGVIRWCYEDVGRRS